MEKSVYTDEHEAVVAVLKAIRADAGVTQVQLAEMLDQSQSFVSKYERGDRRLDIIQLRTVCTTLGVELTDFANRLELAIRAKKNQRQRKRK